MPGSTNVSFSSADQYIRAAMAGLTARQRAIANNVANVDTPNFKASEVRFEDSLKTAISQRQSAADQSSLNAATVRTLVTSATSTRGDGNNVDIDREMEVLGETNLTYSALTQVMSSRLGTLRGIITGR